MKKPTKNEVEKAYQKLQAAKSAYKEWDLITQACIENNIDAVNTKAGQFKIIDLFSEKDIVWKPVAMKRFELKKVA